MPRSEASGRLSHVLGAPDKGLHQHAPAFQVMYTDAPLRPILTFVEAFHDMLGDLGSPTLKALWVSNSPANGIKHAG